MPDMNDNEKQKLDSIIVRILLIFGLGFLAVEAWKNVFERETNKLKKSLEEANRDRPSDPNQSNP